MEQFFTNPGFAHIADEILSHLDHRTLLRCRIVSSAFKKFLDNPKLWLRRCKRVSMSEENEAMWKNVIELLIDNDDIINVDQILDEVNLILMKMSKSFYNVESPINYACKEGKLDILKLTHESMKNEQKFQQCFLDFDFTEPNRSLSPFYLAATFGHLEVVKYLVEYMKFPIYSSWKISPIYNAIIEGHVEIVKYLALKDANRTISIRLYEFAFQRGQLEVMKVLFDTLGVPNVSKLQELCYEAFTLSINLANYESRPFKRIYDYLVRRFGLQIGNDHMSHEVHYEKNEE